MKIIGIDIGATNMRVGLFNESFRLIDRKETITEAYKGPLQALDKLIAMIEEVDKNKEAIAIGIGAPGPLDPIDGVILDAPNLPGWYGLKLKTILEDHFAIPVTIRNDAKVAALGEAIMGAGKDASSVQFITVSTGVGGGYVSSKKIIDGAHHKMSEIGNMIIEPKLTKGTLEDLCSGTNLLKKSKIIYGNDATASTIFDQYEKNDTVAINIINEWILYFSSAIASISQICDPEIFVLGGAVILKNQWLVPLVINAASEKLFVTAKDDIEIKVAELQDDAGLYGAALLAQKKGEN